MGEQGYLIMYICGALLNLTVYSPLSGEQLCYMYLTVYSPTERRPVFIRNGASIAFTD